MAKKKKTIKATKKSKTKSTAKKAVKKVVKKATKKSSSKASKKSSAKATKKAAKKSTKKTAAKKISKPAAKATKKNNSAPATAKAESTPAKTYKGVKIGEQVPDFKLPSTSGEEFSLISFRGKKVVLFFYPKDATPGCTIEGNDFSNLNAQFQNRNAVVFGISRDSLQSHDKFKCDQSFSFELLSDSDEKACKIFDVIQEKNMYGNISMGIERSTFVINEQGQLQKEWRKVKVDGHANEVLENL